MAEARAWVMIPKSDKKATEITIDMRPLVLCKDCKHQYFVCKSGDVICGHVRHESETHNADWFCADGEVNQE